MPMFLGEQGNRYPPLPGRALYMQRHTMTEIVNLSRSTALERSVKTLYGVGWGRLNRFYVATTLALVLPWYTQDISSIRVKRF